MRKKHLSLIFILLIVGVFSLYYTSLRFVHHTPHHNTPTHHVIPTPHHHINHYPFAPHYIIHHHIMHHSKPNPIKPNHVPIHKTEPTPQVTPQPIITPSPPHIVHGIDPDDIAPVAGGIPCDDIDVKELDRTPKVSQDEIELWTIGPEADF